MAEFPELQTLRIHVDEETRRRHMALVVSELRTAARPRRRFRLLAVSLAVFLLLPVIALAAERAQPGDFLYPVRQLIQGSDPIADRQADFFPPTSIPLSEVQEPPPPAPTSQDPLPADESTTLPAQEQSDDTFRDSAPTRPDRTQRVDEQPTREGEEPAGTDRPADERRRSDDR